MGASAGAAARGTQVAIRELGEGALTMTANIRWIAMLAAGASLAGCNSGGDDAPPAGGARPPPDGGTGTPVLARPSKSSTVAITGNDRFVAMVNPETDSISVFDTNTDTKIASVKTGSETRSIVLTTA